MTPKGQKAPEHATSSTQAEGDIDNAPLEEINLSWIALDDLEALPGLVIFGNNQRHREPHTLAL